MSSWRWIDGKKWVFPIWFPCILWYLNTVKIRYYYLIHAVPRLRQSVYRKNPVKKDYDLAKKVGTRIRTLRKQRNLTQEKLSELSGIDAKHIQLMESSKPSNPRVDTVGHICAALGMDFQEFFSDGFGSVSASEAGAVDVSPILKAKSPAQRLSNRGKVVLENASWVLSYHREPRSRGQMRMEPKRKDCGFGNMEPDEKHSLWSLLEDGIRFLDREFRPDGYNVGFDIGTLFGGEGVFVLHIIPRYKGDPESRIGGIVSLLPQKLNSRS